LGVTGSDKSAAEHLETLPFYGSHLAWPSETPNGRRLSTAPSHCYDCELADEIEETRESQIAMHDDRNITANDVACPSAHGEIDDAARRS